MCFYYLVACLFCIFAGLAHQKPSNICLSFSLARFFRAAIRSIYFNSVGSVKKPACTLFVRGSLSGAVCAFAVYSVCVDVHTVYVNSFMLASFACNCINRSHSHTRAITVDASPVWPRRFLLRFCYLGGVFASFGKIVRTFCTVASTYAMRICLFDFTSE